MKTRKELEQLTDEELLEIQQSYWTTGAIDDSFWMGEVKLNYKRENAIDFILNQEVNED